MGRRSFASFLGDFYARILYRWRLDRERFTRVANGPLGTITQLGQAASQLD
ncbi:MAG: hypothetical protein KJO07_14615 [Deltaproteobacteria bacterium]|nr:hypothetical protein [Deltaproteobacteria bacterium]